jgi:hypothetical protein
MTEEQKQAVLARDLNWCMRTGGNIYFLAKIGATDGKSFQQMAGSMTGMTEEYRAMMMGGGRSAEGNRYVGEDGDAQAPINPRAAQATRTRKATKTWHASPHPFSPRMCLPSAPPWTWARPRKPTGRPCSRAMTSRASG